MLKVFSDYTRCRQMHSQDLMQKIPPWSRLPTLYRKKGATFPMSPRHLIHSSPLALKLPFN